ncbi:hypothetical protein L1987_88776 [Smallanthus sonchifolius]|nr:hypothetical protein L1987_88776 [Smallanthus sonchifolius]
MVLSTGTKLPRIQTRNGLRDDDSRKSLSQKENKRPMGVMMKIDMQKAYDRLDWSFLMAVLKKFGFSDSWCQILFSCISNCWYSVSVQGELNAFFKSHRGVRQVEQNVPDC